MKKSELIELASFGVRHKVRAMEQQLAAMWKLFPDIFLSTGAPQLLRPEPRSNGNGAWPALEVTQDDAEHAPKKKKGGGKGRKYQGVKIDVGAYKAIYDYIEAHPGSRLSDIAAAKSVHPANMRGKLLLGIKRGFFVRKGDEFHAKTEPKAE